MKKKISIPYFHKGLKYVTPIIFGIAVYLIVIDYIFWGAILILVGLIIITTHYVTEINLDEKFYMDYLSLLGIKFNKETNKFKTLDRIVITKGNYAQTINTRVQSRQLDWVDYTGTLIVDNNNTLDLLTKNDKKELLKGLKEFADFLSVGIEDRSNRQSYWVDITKN